MKPQPNVGSSHEQEGEQNHEGSGHNVWWSHEYNCYVINRVLAPIHISCVPLETRAKKESQPTSPQGESSRRKQTKEGNDELSFKLFKFPRDNEEYLLEMHEVKMGEVARSEVRVHMSNRKWKVSVFDLAKGRHRVIPILEDPVSNLFVNKYPLTLQERLVGWTIEKKMQGTGREDKFYYHQKRQFWSLVDVTTFIVYSIGKVKNLKVTRYSDDE